MRRCVDQVTARAYTVPTDAPGGDGTAQWSSTTMVVVRARSGDVVGTGWTYGPVACADLVEHLLAGVVEGSDVMSRPRLLGGHGPRRPPRHRGRGSDYAVSAVDVALWDLNARVLGLTLVDLFGGCTRR